jgi:hypothetical protein
MDTAFMSIRTSPYLSKRQNMTIPFYRMPFRELGLSLALVLHGGWGRFTFRRRKGDMELFGDGLFETRGKRRGIRNSDPENRSDNTHRLLDR